MDILNPSNRSASSRTVIDTLAWLIEDAFEGDPSHSILANLRDLQEEVWTAIPSGGGRSIADIHEHVAWLTGGHRRWLASVRALRDDTELDRDRLTNWGERLSTRVIIRIMIAHDLYHAGEINHLRALIQRTDR